MRQAGLLLSAALLAAFPTSTAAAEPLPSPPSVQSSAGWQLDVSFGMTDPYGGEGDVDLRPGEPFAIIAACGGASDVLVLLGPPRTDGLWSGRAFEFPCLPADGGIATTRAVVDSATAADVYVRLVPDEDWPDRVVAILVEQEKRAVSAPSPSASAADGPSRSQQASAQLSGPG